VSAENGQDVTVSATSGQQSGQEIGVIVGTVTMINVNLATPQQPRYLPAPIIKPTNTLQQGGNNPQEAKEEKKKKKLSFREKIRQKFKKRFEALNRKIKIPKRFRW